MGHVLAFSLDTTFGRIGADLLLIVLVGTNAWLGWRFGLVRRGLAFASLYAGLLAASYIGNPIATLTGAQDRLSANVWTFIVLFALVIFMFEVMAVLYQDRIEHMIVITFDRVAGLIAGFLVGLFETGILFLVALAVGNAPAPTVGNTISGNYSAATDAVTNATLGEYVVELKPGMEALFGPALPVDLSHHFAEGTQKSPNSP